MQKPTWSAVSGRAVFGRAVFGRAVFERAVFGRAVSFFIVFVLSFLLTPVTVTAREPDEDDRLTILITASRFAETADETLVPVTVITREEIEEKQANTLEDVLRTVPGLTLGNNGGVGKQTSVFLRGTASTHVLVLIDGVKVGSATAGLTPFQDLPLDQIEKIEVVRGPRSSLYGSEAIGGVIQIFTRKGTKETRPRFSSGAGSHDTKQGEIGVSGNNGKNWYNLGVSAFSTAGFDACTGDEATFRGCSVDDETDDDGYKNQSVSIRGGLQVSDALSLEGNFLNSDGENEYDGSGFSGHETETTTRLISATARMKISNEWRSELMIARAEDQSDNFCHEYDRTPMDMMNFDVFCNDARNPVREKVSSFDTTRSQINWQNNFRLNENSHVVAGIDYLDDEVDSSTNYAEDSRDNTGVFALLRTRRQADDFELSLRADDDEQFGNHTTGSIAWGRDLGGGKRATLSYATAFNAPNFNQLYWPGSGNPDLKPEKARSFDLGFSQTSANTEVAVNFYRTIIDDLIESPPPMFTPDNVNEAEITGVEIAAGTRAGPWDLNASLTFQNPENTGGGDDDGNTLIRRPKRSLTLDLARRFGRYRFGAELFARSKTYADAGNTRTTSGFALLNLRGEVKLHNNWRLLLKVNNVTDKEYETVEYYPQDGLNVLATLRYVP